MSKFKPGDKVKVRKDLEIGRVYGDNDFAKNMGKFRGKIVTVDELTSLGNYRIEEDNNDYIWTNEMLEPVPSFGKHLLRDGVIVKRRDDTYAIVSGSATYSLKGFVDLRDYDDNLLNSDTEKGDIIAIYKPHGYGSISELLTGYGLDLIAKRPEVKEMTLEEICKELGYDVKIVKEA